LVLWGIWNDQKWWLFEFELFSKNWNWRFFDSGMFKNINWWFFKNSNNCTTLVHTVHPKARVEDRPHKGYVQLKFCLVMKRHERQLHLLRKVLPHSNGQMLDKCCFLSCHPRTNRNFSWFLTDRQFANWMRMHPIGLIHHVLSVPIMCMEQYLVCKMNMIDRKPLHLTRPGLAISSISCTLIRETLSLPTKRVTFECVFTSQVSSPIEST
jgi:hypothetical protein